MTELSVNDMAAVDGGMMMVATAAGAAFLVGYAIGTAIYEAW